MNRTGPLPLPDWLLRLLACSDCHHERLAADSSGLLCERCGHRMPMTDGILDAASSGLQTESLDRAYEGWSGRLYAHFMDHPWMQRLDAWLLGMRVDRYYEEMESRILSFATGPHLEIPSGGAPFLERSHVYCSQGPWIFADLSWSMLQRVRDKCQRLDVENVALVRMDARRFPFRNHAIANIFSPFGFHCFHDKPSIFAELRRCLAPGGKLLASALTHDGPRRSRTYLRWNEMDGTFAKDNYLAVLRAYAEDKGLRLTVVRQFGAAAVFEVTATSNSTLV